MPSLRHYSPPARAVQVYESKFTENIFPVELPRSEVAEYAQFLFAMGDNFLHEFQNVAGLSLPVFWERDRDVTTNSDIAQAVSEEFLFCLRWMQIQGDLEKLSTVRNYYETLVNAQRKVLRVEVFVNPSNMKDSTAMSTIQERIGFQIAAHSTLKHKSQYKRIFQVHSDSTIPDGKEMFYAETDGLSLSSIPRVHKEELEAQQALSDVDYTRVIPYKKIIRTQWEDNIEVDVLRSYFDQLALLDEEEQLHGV